MSYYSDLMYNQNQGFYKFVKALLLIIVFKHNFSKGDFMYERIRNLREDNDMTQIEMAQILHCSQRVYSNYERGDVDIPTSVLIQLAQFHQVSVDYLLNLTDHKKLQ